MLQTHIASMTGADVDALNKQKQLRENFNNYKESGGNVDGTNVQAFVNMYEESDKQRAAMKEAKRQYNEELEAENALKADPRHQLEQMLENHPESMTPLQSMALGFMRRDEAKLERTAKITGFIND